MGWLTAIMALLTGGGLLAGIALLAGGDFAPLMRGLGLALGILVATVLSAALGQRFDEAANQRRETARGLARLYAIIGSSLPFAVTLLGNVIVLCLIALPAHGHPLTAWAWSYAAATIPYTWLAQRAGIQDRTLVEVRAYAAHIAYGLLSFAWYVAGVPLPLAALAMLAVAWLPLGIGYALALADPRTMPRVRM